MPYNESYWYDSSGDKCLKNAQFLQDNSGACYIREVCINKDQSEELKNLQRKDYGVDTKYMDDHSMYYDTLATTANLGIGIVILLGVIYTIEDGTANGDFTPLKI